jgi:hypothetical protein
LDISIVPFTDFLSSFLHQLSYHLLSGNTISTCVENVRYDYGGAAAVTGVYDRNEYQPEKRRAPACGIIGTGA